MPLTLERAQEILKRGTKLSSVKKKFKDKKFAAGCDRTGPIGAVRKC